MQRHGKSRTKHQTERANRRRKLLINPAFQWKYVVTISATVLFLSSILSSLLYGVLHYQARQRLIHPETFTSDVSLVVFVFGLAFTVVTAAALGAWFMIVTHRICGPLHVMERYLKELTNGRIPTIRPLRRRDEFKEFFATFQGAVESVRASRQADIEALTETLAALQAAVDKGAAARSDDLDTAMGHVQRMLATARETVGCEADESGDAPVTAPPSKRIAPVGVM